MEASDLYKRRNAALDQNPNIFNYPLRADINIDTRGSDWYWAVCALMAFTTLCIIAHSFTKHRSHRVFHYITAAITLTAAISYFTMASNLGYAAIPVEFFRTNRNSVRGYTRSVFYVRYIDWFITTPLLLLDILLTAGVPWTLIALTIFLDWVMIVTGLVGALTMSSYKWGYFVFAMLALFGIAWNVLWTAREYAQRLGPRVYKTFFVCGGWTLFLWFLYPIAWGLAEGGNVIGSNGEGIFYGVLDILAKVGFACILLYGHSKIDPSVLGCHLRDYDDPIPASLGLGSNKHENVPGGHQARPNAISTATQPYGTSEVPRERGAAVSGQAAPTTGMAGEPRTLPPVSRAAQA